VPRLSKPGALWDSAIGEAQFRATQTAAQAAGVKLHSLPIRGPDDFKDAFDRAAREQIDGVVILSSPLILERRSQIVEWAIKARLPTISLFTLFPGSGGLMAYGPSLPDMYHSQPTRPPSRPEKKFEGAARRRSKYDVVFVNSVVNDTFAPPQYGRRCGQNRRSSQQANDFNRGGGRPSPQRGGEMSPLLAEKPTPKPSPGCPGAQHACDIPGKCYAFSMRYRTEADISAGLMRLDVKAHRETPIPRGFSRSLRLQPETGGPVAIDNFDPGRNSSAG
jgi:hypothetical protein